MVKIGNYEVKPDLLYLNSYTWVKRISDSEALIGITDFGQQLLKDITALTLPSEGQRFSTNSDLIEIESISRDFVIKSPVSCVILEVNPEAANNPELLNEQPYETWILRVEVLDLGDLDFLMDGDAMADQILDEVRSENLDEEIPLDDDFDYETEFSIDSSDAYYEDEEDSYW